MARETGTKSGNVTDRATNGKGDGNKTGKFFLSYNFTCGILVLYVLYG